MALKLSEIHPYEVDRSTGKARLGKANPALIIKLARQPGDEADFPPIFLQGGAAYGAGGARMNKKDLPQAFWDHIGDPKKVSDEALAEVGWPRKKGKGDVEPDVDAAA
jgi:hypothetical protein